MRSISSIGNVPRFVAIGLVATLFSACGGGGSGGNSTAVATAADSGEVVIAAPAPVRYVDADQIFPFITAVEIPDDGQPVVKFQLTDQNQVAILDLGAEDVRFIVAKLQASPVGNLTGDWQSYVNRIEQPGVGPGTEAKLQATAERGSTGTLTNNGDGSYSYRFASSITTLDPDILAQAESEGLDLAYEPDRTHRVAIQFDNAKQPANPVYDWVPATGQTEQILHADVAATANCNGCHEQLALHGGNRFEVQYCVTCHNPGSTDANSGNSVDLAVMAHKIHAGASLPSVQAGGEYAIWGFNDTKHDYSRVVYPQDLVNCQVCHGGTLTGDDSTAQLTNQGDNWSEFATQGACGSCHDNVDFDAHFGGQPDDSNCMSCHQTSGVAGSIRDSHRNLVSEASERFAARILSVTNTAPGEFPRVQYEVFDPGNGDAPYDLQNDPAWTAGGGASRLAIDLAWSTTDYTNTGNGREDASAVSLDALQGTPVGDGSYIVESSVAIPDGSLEPGIPATGSGVAAIEGHPAVDIGSDAEPDIQRIPFTNDAAFFSIDEPGGAAVPRREVAELDKCLSCHGRLSLHGNNRTDNLQVCVACHNPRNTDREVREIAANPPTDGKDEETLDFKVMIHGIHAAAIRQEPLQIVGFQGFSTYVYDEDHVHFPARIENCLTCHADGTYSVPLAANVLGTTIDTGADHSSPVDDTVVSPTAAVCASCHDGNGAMAHMEQNGASFATTQRALDDGEVVEQCATCHAAGRSADVSAVHGLNLGSD
ncbi:MAG: OmcA/MtrC family decaheme c-type cytochrome [Halioglobus sp.]|jgi:OmcA/MtrC family decaheme c-type cytochrome